MVPTHPLFPSPLARAELLQVDSHLSLSITWELVRNTSQIQSPSLPPPSADAPVYEMAQCLHASYARVPPFTLNHLWITCHT